MTFNIHEIPDKVHVSYIFFVPNEKDKIRPIIVIQDAFLSVLISELFQKYCASWIDIKMFRVKRMPFGFSTALRVLNRLIRRVKFIV